MKYLITYDIRDPKRWQKIYKLLKANGLNVQLSCFELDLSQYMLDALLSQIQLLINPKEDVVFAYPINSIAESLIVKLGNLKDLNADEVL